MTTVTKGLIAKEDLNLFDGTRTFSRKTSTGGTATYSKIDYHGVDVLEVFGNGTDRTGTTLLSAAAQVGSDNVKFFLNGEWSISADCDLSAYSNIYFDMSGGAKFSIASGFTLTIYSPVNIQAASNQQIFDGDGSVDFTKEDFGFAEWWGIDGIADEVEINKALIACNKVQLLSSTYVLSAPISMNTDGMELFGKGIKHTQINALAGGNGIEVATTRSTNYTKINDLHVYGGAYGIVLGSNTPNYSYYRSSIKNVYISYATTVGLMLYRTVNVYFDLITTEYCGIGMQADLGASTTAYFTSCYFRLSTTYGSYLRNAVNFHFTECIWEGNNEDGLVVSGTNNRNNTFDTCWFESNNVTGGIAHLYLNASVGFFPMHYLFKNCTFGEPDAGIYSVYIDRSKHARFINCHFYNNPIENDYIYVSARPECIDNGFIDYTPAGTRDLQGETFFTSEGQHWFLEFNDGKTFVSNRANSNSSTLVAEWDFSEDGGAIGDINLVQIPDNAIVTKASGEVVTALTSAGAATVFLGVAVNDAIGLLPGGLYSSPTFGGSFNFVDGDVTAGNDVITVANHGMITGHKITLSTTGTLPAGLSSTSYYAIWVNGNQFRLATNRENAFSNNYVDITGAAGGGTHTATGNLINNVFNLIPDGRDPETYTTKTTSGRFIIMTIADAALTAGKIRLYIEYIVVQ